MPTEATGRSVSDITFLSGILDQTLWALCVLKVGHNIFIIRTNVSLCLFFDEFSFCLMSSYFIDKYTSIVRGGAGCGEQTGCLSAVSSLALIF